MARINDAVERILLYKKVFNILDNPLLDRENGAAPGFSGDYSDPDKRPFSPQADRLATREIAEKTFVLIKNELQNSSQPHSATNQTVMERIPDFEHIHIIGQHRDSKRHLGGGWTVSWQGNEAGVDAHIPSASSVLGGIKEMHGTGRTITDHATGAAADANLSNADVIFVVIGQDPASEGAGDYQDQVLLRQTDRTALDNARTRRRDATVPVVVLLYSPRPLFITQAEFNQMDALVAMWLPGSEGGRAISNVLFDKSKDFFGRSPFTWRFTLDGTVSYPYGFGLKKNQSQHSQGLLP
jgi:beta-glucosidase